MRRECPAPCCVRLTACAGCTRTAEELEKGLFPGLRCNTSLSALHLWEVGFTEESGEQLLDLLATRPWLWVSLEGG